MMALKQSDFERFFTEVHNHPPFEWQKKLADEVFKNGWPKMLDMPTASGKTSVIDIAVFHLALESLKTDRRAPMRVAFVVDRRLVVDGAFDHATKLSDAITKSETPIVKEVAIELKKISPETPLRAVKMRGGMPQDRDWASTPSQPLVIVSTVDQVGSRLLFRGYGVSNSMKPVHAGLLGTDTLFILDEAHTSLPFLRTLDRVRQMQNECENTLPFATMFMSATLPDIGDVFPPKEIRDKILSGDKEMYKRVKAHKYAKLVEARPGTIKDTVIKAALEIVRGERYWKDHKHNQTIRSVGIVVNRVDLARAVFDEISNHVEKTSMCAAVHLLTGRSRPLDRDGFIKSEIDKLKPGSKSKRDGTTFFVATQCIEVGVDIDFDVLVTQIAPLDSLRQRFGRLDRIGDAGASDACIVADKSEISGKHNDIIYKDRLSSTWKYLKDVGGKDGVVDFGTAYLKIDASVVKDTMAPVVRPVHLFPQYVKSWIQTNPIPRPDPEPSIFLHGNVMMSADVQVIWRADLTLDMFVKNDEDNAKSGLATCIPSALEAISVPIWIIKKWLNGERDETMSDIEGSIEENGIKTHGNSASRVLLWRGIKNNMTKFVNVDAVHPGDTIIVPAARGGCDKYGWNQYSKEEVRDLGMESDMVHRSRLSMRLDTNVLKNQHFNDEHITRIFKIATSHSNIDDPYEFVDALISADALPVPWQNVLDNTVKASRSQSHQTKRSDKLIKITDRDERERIVGFSIRLDTSQANALSSIIQDVELHNQVKDLKMHTYVESSTEDEEDIETNNEDLSTSPKKYTRNTNVASVEVELIPHCQGVSKHVDDICNKIGVSKHVRDDIVLAGLLHDVGKAEKRVQAFLRRMDPDDVDDSKVLAKSAYREQSYAEYVRYIRLAHLPDRYRHECWSVVMAESHPDLKKAHDPDLVKYLIGTHHGHGRPFFPLTNDIYASSQIEFDMNSVRMKGAVKHGLARLDCGWIDMCDRLYAKYGAWGLAYMEAIIRLADHQQSHEEEYNDKQI